MKLLVAVLALALTALGAPSSRAQATLDPETLREAQALMARFDTVGMMRQQMAGLEQQMNAIVRSANFDQEGNELMGKFISEMKDRFQQQMPKYAEGVTLIYARQFTLEELKQINAFYDSPIGQKVSQKTPLIVRESAELSASLLGPVVQDLLAELKAEVEKKRAKQDIK